MKLSVTQQNAFDNLSKDLLNNKDVLKMQDYIQHGKINTYTHCREVAKTALYLNRALKMKADEKVLVQAGILHDFYLYDWHKTSVKVPLFKMHGFVHAKKASENAKNILHADENVCKAISTHMWPLTLTHVPTSKEAWLLCMADKICAMKETVFER